MQFKSAQSLLAVAHKTSSLFFAKKTFGKQLETSFRASKNASEAFASM
jgi:hypothetical protein